MIDRTSFIKKQLLECNVDPDLVENWCLLAQHNDHYFDLMFSWWEENNAEEKHKIIKKLQKNHLYLTLLMKI